MSPTTRKRIVTLAYLAALAVTALLHDYDSALPICFAAGLAVNAVLEPQAVPKLCLALGVLFNVWSIFVEPRTFIVGFVVTLFLIVMIHTRWLNTWLNRFFDRRQRRWETSRPSPKRLLQRAVSRSRD